MIKFLCLFIIRYLPKKPLQGSLYRFHTSLKVFDFFMEKTLQGLCSSLTAVLSIILLTGCADKPNSLGSGLPTPYNMFTFAETTLTSTNDSTFLTPLVTGFGVTNLVGRLDNNEEVVSLFNFVPLVSLDSLANATLDTVEFYLTVNYKLRANQIPTKFDLYEVLQSWSQSTVTSDTVISYGTTVLGTFSDSMNYGQTVKIRIEDTSVVRRWINASRDTSQPRFYGFVLRPKAGENPGIVGFTTFSDGVVYPTLVIKYTTRYGTFDSLAVTFGQDAYIGKYNSLPTPLPFQVKAGFAIRSKINFDPSFIKDKPIINRAKLTLVVDTTQSIKGGYSPDSLLIFLGGENDSVTSLLSLYYYAYGVLTKDETTGEQKYVFEAGTLFQTWINNLYPNQGLILRWAFETNANEKVVFYDSRADSSKRPSVEITYSK